MENLRNSDSEVRFLQYASDPGDIIPVLLGDLAVDSQSLPDFAR